MRKNTKTIDASFTMQVRKVGLVSRNYNEIFPNGYRDFSYVLPSVLDLLDAQGCDTALFALYSIVPRGGYNVLGELKDYEHIKMICLEEFKDNKRGRKAGSYVVYYRLPSGWAEYRFKQVFGQVNWQRPIIVQEFAQSIMPRRIIGNSCILICGESNGVKYDKTGSQTIIDPCGVRAAIPDPVEVVLNAVHDRMSRFEMVKKRSYLSEGKRVVLSVWNSGKADINGKVRDGKSTAWRVYRDGELMHIAVLDNALGVEVGVVDIKKASQ